MRFLSRLKRNPRPVASRVSPELAAALRSFAVFLISDDLGRGQEIEASTSQTLTVLDQSVHPLLGEIDAFWTGSFARRIHFPRTKRP